jgi:hypothetical protein
MIILRSLQNSSILRIAYRIAPKPPKTSEPHSPFVHFPELISHSKEPYQETHIIYVGMVVR